MREACACILRQVPISDRTDEDADVHSRREVYLERLKDTKGVIVRYGVARSPLIESIRTRKNSGAIK
jgi:hypothetical protein